MINNDIFMGYYYSISTINRSWTRTRIGFYKQYDNDKKSSRRPTTSYFYLSKNKLSDGKFLL